MFEYPYKDDAEKSVSNIVRSFAYQGDLCSNRSMDRFSYTVVNAPIIQLYSVNGDKVEKYYEWIGSYADYEAIDNNGQMISASVSDDSRLAFLMSYATERYIYLLYSGRSYNEADMDAYQSASIYQIDWSGNPVRRIELDAPAITFCVSDDDSAIFAFVNHGETELVKYEIAMCSEQNVIVRRWNSTISFINALQLEIKIIVLCHIEM